MSRVKTENSRVKTKVTFVGRIDSSINLFRFGGHNEIIFMKTFDYMGPPLNVLVARITKSLLHRPLVNLVRDGNHKTQPISLVG